MWDSYAQTSGDLSELPEMTPPPSPTPAEILSFQASIGDFHDCGPNFTVNYWIGNNGNLDLESASVKLVDLDTSITLVGPAQSNAPFVTSPTSCPLVSLHSARPVQPIFLSALLSQIPPLLLPILCGRRSNCAPMMDWVNPALLKPWTMSFQVFQMSP